MIKLRDTLLIRLGFVALSLLAMIATFGLVLQIAYQTEQQIATRLAQAEMNNIAAKIAGLDDQQKVVEIALIVASRHMASQLARGADLANGDQALTPNPLSCATPQRDRRVIGASFAPDQLPGEAETKVSGTPLDWTKVSPEGGTIQQILIPTGAACNTVPVSAQVIIARFGKTTLVTGWMTETLQQLAVRHWKPASLAFGVLLSIGVCVALLMEQRSRAQMRQLTFVLKQVGEGNFDARPVPKTQDSEYRQLSDAILAMAGQLKHMHAGLNSLMDRTAHDLRTPLARAIARINSVIEKQSDPNDLAQLQDVEADLRDLSGRFGAMLALREAAALDPNLGEPINLAEIAELAAGLYQDLDIGQGKVITLDVLPAWVCAQRGLIQNAVANLLDNALRFTPVGGQVDIVTRTVGNMAILILSDSGQGLDPSLGLGLGLGLDLNPSAEIFEAGVTTRAHDGGYGLGLATVREVARRYGGTITLENRAEQPGAIATLSFMAVPDQLRR